MNKIELELRISNPDHKLITAIYEALNPDNIESPEGFKILLNRRGKMLIVDIESNRRIETLISTADEILENIQSVVDTLESVVKS